MTSFVNRLFTVSSFESDFPLVLDVDGEIGKKIVMPEGIRYENLKKRIWSFIRWEKKLENVWLSKESFFLNVDSCFGNFCPEISLV